MCGLRRLVKDATMTRTTSHCGGEDPTARFSARLRRRRVRNTLRKNFGHEATDLLPGGITCPRFPGAADGLSQRTSEHDLIMDDADHIGPAVNLLRGSPTGVRPYEVVVVEAISVLLAGTTAIPSDTRRKRNGRYPMPENPPDVLGATRWGKGWAGNTHHSDRLIARLVEMHLVPRITMGRTIGSAPCPIGRPIGFWRIGAEEGAIFAWCPTLARAWRGGTKQIQMGLQAQQDIPRQFCQRSQKSGDTIRAIRSHDRSNRHAVRPT
jgi:hypothetical protein